MKFTAEKNGARLDMVLAAAQGVLSRSNAQRIIEQGNCTVNGRVEKASYKVQSSDEIEYTLIKPQSMDAIPQDIPLNIVYEDECMLVVNKPKGMVVHPAAGNYSGTLVNALLAHCEGDLSGIGGKIRPGIVHRIDKDTEGLLIVAKTDIAHVSLSEQIKEHTAYRTYVAIVIGHLSQTGGMIDAPIGRHPKDRKKMAVISGGRNAITHYEVIEEYRGFSLVQFRLETGRTHQIRVHSAYIGHPILGDELYGGARKDYTTEGQALQAVAIEFTHPVTGNRMKLSVPYSESLQKLITKMRSL